MPPDVLAIALEGLDRRSNRQRNIVNKNRLLGKCLYHFSPRTARIAGPLACSIPIYGLAGLCCHRHLAR